MHEGPVLSYGPLAPDFYLRIPESERSTRAELTDDICIVDEKHFFIRGSILLPIRGTDKNFGWLIWVSLSEQNMKRVFEMWERPGREKEPPYFGWLSTALPGYPPTLNLKTKVHTMPIGLRPTIELEPTEHPLAIEQREGITWDRVLELNALAEHGSESGPREVKRGKNARA